jgi:hypothetical protein
MEKNKMTKPLIVGGMALAGLVAGIATMAGAQTAAVGTTTVVPAATAVTSQGAADTPEPGDVADVPGAPDTQGHGHAPLGGDGVVSSVSGSTIVMAEESDEGSASYTIDASAATIMNNGVAGSISDIKAGEKIFVKGATSGTNVTATSISIGHPGGRGDKAGDTDGTGANEAAESATSSDAAGE